jgi:hypothetical protein
MSVSAVVVMLRLPPNPRCDTRPHASLAAGAIALLLSACSTSPSDNPAGDDAGRGPGAQHEVATTGADSSFVESGANAEAQTYADSETAPPSGSEAAPPSGSDGSSAPMPREPALNGVYVPNTKSVSVFALLAQGNIAPIRTLSGPSAMLRAAGAVAVDSVGELFVANEDMFGTTSIQVYPRLANGEAAPIRLLSVPSGMSGNGVVGLAVGPNDDLWVGQYNAYHFPPKGMSSDSSIGAGPNLAAVAIIGDGEVVLAASGGTIATYSGADAGTTMPVRTLVTGMTIRSVAVANQTIFVLAPNGVIAEFPASAIGAAIPSATFMAPTTALQTAHAIAVDPNDNPPVLYLAADDATSGTIYAAPLIGSAPAYTLGTPTSLHGALTTLASATSLFVVHY